MDRIGECASCRSDVMVVAFDAVNGCRFCIGCGRRGPDAPLVVEMQEEPTVVDLSEEVTQISTPAPELIAIARGNT